MALPLVELADVLRAAGLTVVECADWKTRHRGGADGFAPKAVLWHHDASPPGDSPGVVAYMLNPANLGAQIWVDRDGVWHLLAAGRMHHAGTGIARGVIRANRGNDDSVGVETDHTIGEDWPPVQLDSLRRGTAAIMRHYDWSASDALWGHKETAPGRKPDPDGLDMAHERRTVAALIKARDDDTRGDNDMGGITYVVMTKTGRRANIPYCVSSNGTDLVARGVKFGERAAMKAAGVPIAVLPENEFNALLVEAIAPAEKE